MSRDKLLLILKFGGLSAKKKKYENVQKIAENDKTIKY